MAIIITREVGATAKGSTLSNTELDQNFINLNAATQPAGGTTGQILSKTSNTDYDSQWIDNYATQIKFLVKNNTGSTLTKGSVVYVSGGQGANALISLALATSDSTSATTVGFLETTLANGESGLVVVAGVISGINTSAASEGDSVWLSGTVAGGVVYGNANKPQAPIHIVYLGTVTRAHATQGEIQVHISNGWELSELHDVQINSLANAHVLAYDAPTGVWKNRYLLASDIPNLDAAKITSGTIDAARLPSYVDDVLEYANIAGFPGTGETGKIYVALDTNKTYRWSGSTYVYITSGAVDSVAGKTGVVTLNSSDVGLGNVDNTADSAKNVLSANRWTTSRTVTIGNTGKALDGSANVSWTLAEIGAQAAGTYLTPKTIYTLESPANATWYTIAQNTTATESDVSGKFVVYDQTALPNHVTFIADTDSSYGYLSVLSNSGFGSISKIRVVITGTTALVQILINGSVGQPKFTFESQTGTNTWTPVDWTADATSYSASQIKAEIDIGSNPGALIHAGKIMAGGLKTQYEVLHLGNYNSYTPTLTGTGASGTWGINVTGSAGSIAWTNVTGRPTALSSFTNDSGYITGITSANVTTALGYTPYNATNPNGYITGITSANVTTALGYTPYNATNPNGYITSSGSISGSAGSATYATYAQIIDTRAGQYTPNAYQDYRATFEFTNQIISGWHSAITMQGWHDGYAAWQIIGGADSSTHENWYLRSGVNTTWNSLRTILHSGNYNNYSPTLTGTGASGTWGISITGNAATATSATTADQIDSVAFRNTGSNASTAADSLNSNGITYVGSNISLFGQSDGALYSQAYSSEWQHQIFGDYRTGQIAIRGKNNGTWQSWRAVLDATNYTSYAPSLTGSGASGTWGINITGNAATATKILRYSVDGYNWNGVALSIYWTRIGRVTGDSAMMVSIYGSTDNNYAPATKAIATFKSFSGGSTSAQLDTLTANENDVRIAIDNSGDCWIYVGVTWGSFVRYNIEEQYGVTIYSSPTQQIGQPANSLALLPGQAVRATSGNVTVATPYNTNFQAGSITARGTFNAIGAITQNSNQVLHAGNYTSYSPSLTGSGASGTWGINITGNAATVGSLSVHSGRNNEANKIVRTDGNGYIQAGWINTDSGDSGVENRLSRIYSSHDGYVRYSTLTDFKVHMGLSAKNNYSRRIDYTSDSNYWVGSMGHSGYGANETFHGGSGFFDIWSGTNYPGSTTHIHGFNAVHYTTNSLGTTGGSAYGIQVAGQYTEGGELWSRGVNNGSFSAWRRQLDSSNYTSYSPTLTGSGASGTWGINITGNAATVTNGVDTNSTQTISGYKKFNSTNNSIANSNGTLANLEVLGVGGAAFMAFHRPGLYAAYFGLDSDNVWKVGGWSTGSVAYTLLHSNNYNSYSPTLTGTGASGTWGINVTGSAGSASSASSATNASYCYNYTQGFNSNWNTDFQDAPAGSTILRGDTSSGSSSNGPGGSWWFQQNMRHNNSGGFWGVQVAWGWEDNAHILRTRNVQSGVYSGWVTYLNSNNYSSYALPLSGGNVTGSTQIASLGVGTAASGTSGEIRATNNVTAYFSSDINLKENITDIPNAIAAIMNIGGKLFDWKDSYIQKRGGEDGYFVCKQDFGVIAQDVQKHFPRAVRIRPDGTLAVDYEKLSALAFAGIVEQNKEISELKSRLEILENLVNKLIGD